MKGIFIQAKLWYREFWQKNQTVTITPTGPRMKVPLKVSLPAPVTIGSNSINKETKFIWSDVDRMSKYYTAYRNIQSNFLTYCDIIYLHKNNTGFESGTNTHDIVIDKSDRIWEVPPELMSHKEHAVETFKKIGKIKPVDIDKNLWLNETSLRIRSWSPDGIVKIQPADYFSQVGTNLTLDWASQKLKGDDASTIRNSIELPASGLVNSLEASNLANTLGVACFLVTGDNRLYTRIRSKNQAVMAEGKLHCSASGVYAWKPELMQETNSFELFEMGMHNEIYKELNLKQNEYELIPLAFARELPRGGKPQLFFLAKTDYSYKEIEKKSLQADERTEFLTPDMIPRNSSLLQWINPSAPIIPTQTLVEACWTYEGWASYLFVTSFLENTEPPS